jgi:hypothetical protein
MLVSPKNVEGALKKLIYTREMLISSYAVMLLRRLELRANI